MENIIGDLVMKWPKVQGRKKTITAKEIREGFMEKLVFELDLSGLGARTEGWGDRRRRFHIQRAQIARLQSQEIWIWKSKQFSVARAWRA